MRPDDVCGNYKSKKKINIRVEHYIKEDEDDVEEYFMVVEGEAEALEFVGNLFLAQARYKEDCSFHISPVGAGSIFFNRKSTHGLHIHRLPCDHNDKKGKQTEEKLG